MLMSPGMKKMNKEPKIRLVRTDATPWERLVDMRAELLQSRDIVITQCLRETIAHFEQFVSDNNCQKCKGQPDRSNCPFSPRCQPKTKLTPDSKTPASQD